MTVVISNWPVALLKLAVDIPMETPVEGRILRSEIDFAAPITGCTIAPTSGATPNPPVNPNETIFPPLGSWFWLTSIGSIMVALLSDVIPVNTISDSVVPTATNE